MKNNFLKIFKKRESLKARVDSSDSPLSFEAVKNRELPESELLDEFSKRVLEIDYYYDSTSATPSFFKEGSKRTQRLGSPSNGIFNNAVQEEIHTKAFVLAKPWIQYYRFYFKKSNKDWQLRVYQELKNVLEVTVNSRDASYVNTFQYVRNEIIKALSLKPESVYTETNSDTIFFYDNLFYLNKWKEKKSHAYLVDASGIKQVNLDLKDSRVFLQFDYESTLDVGHSKRKEKTTRFAQLVDAKNDFFTTYLNGEYRSYNYENASNILFYSDFSEEIVCVKAAVEVKPCSGNINGDYKVFLTVE